MSSLNLHIDRLVVHGIARAEGRRLAIALEEKLRQWAESGLGGIVPPDSAATIRSLDAGELRPNATSAQAAAQIVQAIQTGLNARSTVPSKLSNRSRHV
jgi:hypothetical protein